MANLSYSANFEDVIINRALADVVQGFYIDVGAYLPVACSNTCRLYQKGWRGIVVEPQARFHPLWQAQRPQDILVGNAIGDQTGTVTWYDIAGHEQNCTTDLQIATLFRQEGKVVAERPMEQTTLNALIAAHRPTGDIHLLCIDVEGAEARVLRGLDLQKNRPWLLVLEATLPNRAVWNHQEWEPSLLQQGYEFVYFDAANRYYLANEHLDLKPRFAYPPCVWDQFVDYRLAHYEQLSKKLQHDLETLKSRLRELAQ